MDDLINIDIESLTEEERRELRSKITSRLGLVSEAIEEEKSSSLKPLQLVEEVEEYNEVLEVSEPDPSMSEYLDTLRRLKKKDMVSEDADFMSGGPAATPATMADIASLRTALSSLGGGGMGETEVESLINTTVINNFGLTPLDSGAASTFDSADVVTIVDSDYIEQRLPQDVKVRFRLDATTPVILNSSGVTSVTTTGSGQLLKFNINFDTPFASADDYITMLTLDQEGTDRTSTLIPLVNAESRTPVVIQQNTGSVQVAVEKVDTADNQDEGVLNVKIFNF